MNYLMHSGSGASGVDMDKVIKVGKALLFSHYDRFCFCSSIVLIGEKNL